MKFRANTVPHMWYPEDEGIDRWNLVITIVLIFTSLVAPARVAFITEDSFTWIIINFLVDFFFFVDILVIFNSAIYDEEFQII